jgi:hypothetical protein
MKLYAILRREGWKTPEDLRESAERSLAVANQEMANEVRWIRSYVLEEGVGSIGTICIYEAIDEAAVRRHGVKAELPVDEVIPILDTVIVRPDPVYELEMAGA